MNLSISKGWSLVRVKVVDLKDDENLINRTEEGIRAYFGRRDISKITTKDIRIIGVRTKDCYKSYKPQEVLYLVDCKN